MSETEKLVVTSKLSGDHVVYRATMYTGPLRFIPELQSFVQHPLTPAQLAAATLTSKGHIVEQTDMPGLFRIDGGPEITTNQLISLASGL